MWENYRKVSNWEGRRQIGVKETRIRGWDRREGEGGEAVGKEKGMRQEGRRRGWGRREGEGDEAGGKERGWGRRYWGVSEFSPVCRIVRPTQLRLSRDYILFYSTWTWVGSRAPTLYTLQSTLYTLQSTLFTLHSTLYTLQSTLLILHSIPYTLNSKL